MNLLASSRGRRFLFALLYLSEGAPIGFVWWSMPTLLRNLGLEVASITTLTSIATLPWVLKFLVAPLIDAGSSRSIPVRRWILVCQLLMAVSLLPLLFLDWAGQFGLVIATVVVHAVFAAVQDVGIDTLAIRTVPPSELGRVNGSMQAGMLLGRAGVAAGTTLIFAAVGSPAPAVVVLIGLILLPASALLFAANETPTTSERLRVGKLLRLVSSRASFAGLFVALVIGAGFEYFGVGAGPRLTDLGYSGEALALFYGLLAPGGLAAGALGGGALADRLGVVHGTGISFAVLTVMLAAVAADDFVGGIPAGQMTWFAVTYVGIGMLTASSYALFMTLSRGTYAATRISLFMAMTNGCEAWAAFTGGRLFAHGYGFSLTVMTALACTALIPLYLVWKDRDPNGTVGGYDGAADRPGRRSLPG